MAELTGGQLQTEVENTWPKLGILTRKLQAAVNTVARAAGVAAVGEVAAPGAPAGVQVAVAGEMMHVAITHDVPVDRNVRYFTEIANTPAFSQPIVIDHGTSRTSHPFPLPTMDAGGAVHSWYVRSFAQYPGSAPSKPVAYGGATPQAVRMGGTTQMTLLPSTGSGTASGNGQTGGAGLGHVSRRPAMAAAKRAV